MTYKQRQTLIGKLLIQNKGLRYTKGEQLEKCWFEEINGEQMQVFCNGALVIALNEENKVDVPTHTEGLDIVKRFFDVMDDYTLNKTDFDLKELKQNKEERFDIGNGRYNTKYFISCAEALGKDTVFYQNENNLRPSYFKGSAGIGLIMPCRK